jgi:hypothetical protein
VSERDAAQTAWSNRFMQLCTVLLALPLQGRKHLLGWIKDAVDPDVFLRRLLKPLHVSNVFQRLSTSSFEVHVCAHLCKNLLQCCHSVLYVDTVHYRRINALSDDMCLVMQ